MAENTSSSQSGGVGCLTLLGLLFIGLKLTHYIAWSWWWVLAPFWVPAVIVTVIMLLIVVGVAVMGTK